MYDRLAIANNNSEGQMYSVIKRDGQVVDFDLTKIKNAIIKAFDACGKQYHPDMIDFSDRF